MKYFSIFSFTLCLCLAISGIMIAQENGGSGSNPALIHLTVADEPGKPFVLTVIVQHLTTRQPVKNASVHVYHTDHKGDYQRDARGIARINGTATAAADGQVVFHTIYPRGYNDADTGEHMHFKVSAVGFRDNSPTLNFADFYRKRYDLKNPRIQTVYLESLTEKDGVLQGKAYIFLAEQG